MNSNYEPTCGRCKFYRQGYDKWIGKCHLNPPIYIRHEQKDEKWKEPVWELPTVTHEHFCSHFNSKGTVIRKDEVNE